MILDKKYFSLLQLELSDLSINPKKYFVLVFLLGNFNLYSEKSFEAERVNKIVKQC